MNLSPSTYNFAVDTYSFTLQWPVRECLQTLARRGFREFELQMYPGHLWPAHIDKQTRRDLKAYIADNGLSVTTLNMPNIDLNITAATAEMRTMTRRILRQVIELGGDLGVDGVVIGPGKVNPLFPMPRIKLMDLFYLALNELVPLAKNEGTSIFVENMPFAFLPGAQEILDALETYGDQSIGLVYDVANGHFVRENLVDSLRACAPRLRAVHLSDTDQTVYRHSAIGLGTVDFSPLPKALAEIGFSKRPILEIISSEPNPDEAVERSARQLVELGF